jgi:hypothetical protein
MTTLKKGSVQVGVFEDRRRAQDALTSLREIGLLPQQPGYAARLGEVLQTAGTLDAVDVPEHDLAGGLIALGVPVVNARALGLELERGCAIVAVQPKRLLRITASVLGLAGAVSVQTWASRWLVEQVSAVRATTKTAAGRPGR